MNIFERIIRHERNLETIWAMAERCPDIETLGSYVICADTRPFIRFLNATEDAALKFAANHRDGKWTWTHPDSDPREFTGELHGVAIAIECRKKAAPCEPLFQTAA